LRRRRSNRATQLRLLEERGKYEVGAKRFPIVEIFGFPHDNESEEARRCREDYVCPFIGTRCTKGGHGATIPLGTCTVHSRYGPIITCPLRFYEDNHQILTRVAAYLLGDTTNSVMIPEVGPTQTYNLDWIVARYDDRLQLCDYHGVEVQTIDITGSVRPYFEAYLSGKRWEDIDHRYGINWANVFKRTLPQLLAKGAMLSSYDKKLAVVVQDQLVAYLGRTGRLKIEEESNPSLVNLVFFEYELRHFAIEKDIYRLELTQLIPTTVRRLETSFIAGLVMARMPTREEFDQVVANKMAARLLASQGSGQ